MTPKDWLWVPDRSWYVPATHATRCRINGCTAPPDAELDRAARGWTGLRWSGWCRHHLESDWYRIDGRAVLAAVDPDSPAAKQGWTE